jgi:RNA methyltransferase, TrmH family
MITSRDNSFVKFARRVRDGKETNLIFVEGVRLCEEAVKSGLKVETTFHTPQFGSNFSHDARDERHAQLLESLNRNSSQIFTVSESVFASLSDTKTPQGIAAVARRPPSDAKEFARRMTVQSPLLLVLHRINNPSNAGAIVRAAEAAGANGVIVTLNSTDIFSSKALRGAMGSSFRMPLWTRAPLEEVFAWCRNHGIRTICALPRAENDYTEFDWRTACALVVGEEGGGLTDAEIASAGARVKISMREPVESLNVAVAAAVILFEAARQRST